jgi:hypothetical protein
MFSLTWYIRCIPGFSIIVVISLTYFALWAAHTDKKQWGDRPITPSPDDDFHPSTSFFQAVFVFYTITIHILALVFPIRACWAVWSCTRGLQSVLAKVDDLDNPDSKADCGQATTVTVDPLQHLFTTQKGISNSTGGLLQAILLPNYKEEVGVLEETLEVLACHGQAKSSYDVSYS